MSAHTCKTLTDGCYRCDLNRDEIEAVWADIRGEAEAAWIAYRDDPAATLPRTHRRDFINGYLAANEMSAVES